MTRRKTIVEMKIEDLPYPNKGFGIVDGKKIFVKGGVPGQKVKVLIKKRRANYCEGKILEVLENSPIEKETSCVHFGKCGGCTYQAIPYEKQLEMKVMQVKNLFEDEGIEGYEFLGIEKSPQIYEYRNKMEFTFGDEGKDKSLSLGLHKRGKFYEVVNVQGCNIVDEDFSKVLATVLNCFIDMDISYYNKKSHQGVLRNLVMRKALSTGEILINLVTTSQIDNDLKDFIDSLLGIELDGKIVGILHTINDSISDAIKVDKLEVLYGRNYIIEETLSLKFKISSFSFFQTNTFGAEKLYSIVRDFAGNVDDKIVFDLYCGTGTISQIMATCTKKVIGIELVEEAVEMARENARLNGLLNCEFIAGDVLKEVDKLKDKPDLVILDPPRDGINPKALKKILSYNPEKFVYVSCNPVSLVRDLKEFVNGGYIVEKVKCMDMFPMTPHVETVVLLSQRKADNHIEVDLDLDGLDVTSAESKATYNEIQQYVLKETGLMVSNLYIAQIKKKCGIDVGECFNKPKTENAKQPKCPEDKEKAIKDALKHFGMI